MNRTILALGAAGLLVLGACGDDDAHAAPAAATDGATSSPTAAGDQGYCDELAARGDDDPGFDAFFEEHPEPTLEDWAAFLPGPIALLHDGIDEMAALTPPADAADEHETVLEALRTMTANFEVALAAAEAGDQETYDRLEAENQDVAVPAVEAAMAALGEACGSAGPGAS